MKVVAGLIVAGAIVGGLLLPAGTPALEAAYMLTADRVLQSANPYQELRAPLDALFLYAHIAFGERTAWLLRGWKAMGGIALAAFFWKIYTQSTLRLAGLLWASVALGAYLLLPWRTAIEVGEPMLWLLLLINRPAHQPFLRGVVSGVGIGLYPISSLAAIWITYRRLEERAGQALWLWSAGLIWSSLGIAAATHTVGLLKAYSQAFWFASWQDIQQVPYTDWVLRLAGLLLLIARGQEYFRQPYAERRLFRDRLWASLATIPTSANIPLWLSLLMESRGSLILRYGSLLLPLLQGLRWAETIVSRPDCRLVLSARSCLWGEPLCYVRLQSPYACDWTVPFRWKLATQRPDWSAIYDRWGNPSFIYDAAGLWSEARYFIPYRTAPFTLCDTTLPGIQLYQRR
ncbi:MAG: hypothetical protein N3E49_04460 [Bacteroidia bacterium]|nr:hypothetical protein [Bacteroidia bacterium]